jgi:hypothetical protein
MSHPKIISIEAAKKARKIRGSDAALPEERPHDPGSLRPRPGGPPPEETSAQDRAANEAPAPLPQQIRDQAQDNAQDQAQEAEHAYHARILSMNKVELLEEMVRFQEERTREGKLTAQMMRQGRHLFRALENWAESRELQILSRSYRRHLEAELDALRRGT